MSGSVIRFGYNVCMEKPKPKKRRLPPLKIEGTFDEAMVKIIKAKPLPKKKKA